LNTRRRFVPFLLLLIACSTLGACDGGAGREGEDRLVSVRIDDVNRTANLYVPANYNAKADAPLVLAFHGSPGNGPGMRISTGLDEIADKEGWLMAYPNGSGGGWAAGCNCSDPDFAGVDDVDFIRRLIARINDEYPVDKERIYAVGFSMGGVMSYRLACDLAPDIAAVGAVSSTMSWKQMDTCTPDTPVPLIMMIGDNDASFPWTGTGLVGGSRTPPDTTLAFWKRKNLCVDDLGVDYNAPKDGVLVVRRERYQSCAGGGEITRYVIEDGVHAWPGFANETLLAFFKRHQRSLD